ncbi:unnamed protein product [Vitrella brassicaformis CCMP3155]|uniref:Major facilitator superfamily (MFS) profile domain-containing protein n=1 Tax=Vitrella brassicaformis (strain CCMP3155) TaxID=1169540 RepID=A0A0G4EPA2_VITBC|nr:unnamed protein product [Vitrella brassicaformis CCMP3155]|eukprot:CEL99450.1 unnamed protein product [Vitrella brassicaformis CCMP3155]
MPDYAEYRDGDAACGSAAEASRGLDDDKNGIVHPVSWSSFWRLSRDDFGAKVRWRVVVAAVLFLGNIICYADRTNIGIAILSFPISPDDTGIVLSSFFWGYICLQYPGALLAHEWGPKATLLAAVVTWTFFDLLTVPATSVGLWALLLARIGMGLGEAMTFPCQHIFSSLWIPRQERTTLVTLITSGQDTGTILALTLSPHIVRLFGWQYVFVIWGCVALVWVGLCCLLTADRPETHRWMSWREKSYIRLGRSRIEGEGLETALTSTASFFQPHSPLTWQQLFLTPSCWAIYIAHMTFNYGWYVLLSWLPKYLTEQFHLDLASHSLLAASPYVCAALGMVLAGSVADWLLVRAHFRLRDVRKLMTGLGLGGGAIFLFCAGNVARDATQALTYLACALFFVRMATAGFWTNMIDIAPHHAGQLMGVSNTLATLPGIFGNVATQYLLDLKIYPASSTESNWSLVFNVAVVLYLIGALVYACLGSDIPIHRSVTMVAVGQQMQMQQQEGPYVALLLGSGSGAGGGGGDGEGLSEGRSRVAVGGQREGG